MTSRVRVLALRWIAAIPVALLSAVVIREVIAPREELDPYGEFIGSVFDEPYSIVAEGFGGAAFAFIFVGIAIGIMPVRRRWILFVLASVFVIYGLIGVIGSVFVGDWEQLAASVGVMVGAAVAVAALLGIMIPTPIEADRVKVVDTSGGWD